MITFLRAMVFVLSLASGALADAQSVPSAPAAQADLYSAESSSQESSKLQRLQEIKEAVLRFGPWALAVYILLYAANTVSIFPPIVFMSLSAGFIFGVFWGAVGIMAGSFLGTSLTFLISRLIGRRFVEKLARGKGRDFEDQLNKNGFAAILFIRLIPLIPWEIVNYVSGLSKIRYRDYVFGTLIGIFPAVLVQTFFSDQVSSFRWNNPWLWAALAGFLLLGSAATIYLKVQSARTKRKELPGGGSHVNA
ncbi:MAG: TVP38/TMEM64 family protein [Candidatus Omnitrophota bacterium]|nr:TVP38/TMEM64 family protein [Candidatus Omnitrophota bacterium]MDZ4241783.1 TVP38/TMEM64 family protein [Candidatus Omnitrophota bacterium]